MSQNIQQSKATSNSQPVTEKPHGQERNNKVDQTDKEEFEKQLKHKDNKKIASKDNEGPLESMSVEDILQSLSMNPQQEKAQAQATITPGDKLLQNMSGLTSPSTSSNATSALAQTAGGNKAATLNPEMAKQWHPTKNGKLTPFDVSPRSSKMIWWKCEKGDDIIQKVSNLKNSGIVTVNVSGSTVTLDMQNKALIISGAAAQWNGVQKQSLRDHLKRAESTKDLTVNFTSSTSNYVNPLSGHQDHGL